MARRESTRRRIRAAKKSERTNLRNLLVGGHNRNGKML